MFEVVGERWPGFGYFPYDVQNEFPYDQNPNEIVIESLKPETVPVASVLTPDKVTAQYTVDKNMGQARFLSQLLGAKRDLPK